MVRQSDVKGAYTKVGDPSVRRYEQHHNKNGTRVTAIQACGNSGRKRGSALLDWA